MHRRYSWNKIDCEEAGVAIRESDGAELCIRVPVCIDEVAAGRDTRVHVFVAITRVCTCTVRILTVSQV